MSASTNEPERIAPDTRPTTPRRVAKDAKGRPMVVVHPNRMKAGAMPRVSKRTPRAVAPEGDL